YEALSYVWGDSKVTVQIRISEQLVDVTVNVYAALRCLRVHHFESILWIDALCI
ncbi:hypothetical protein BU25DRAFT_305191, partial [Macroventuria anomochaeta]